MMDAMGNVENETAPEHVARPVPAPHERVRLRFANTRRGEIALLACTTLLAVLMAVGATFWDSSSWLHQVCPWLGVMSALLFSALLASSLFRPQAVTVRLVRLWVATLLGIAGLAILCAVLGFFV